MIARLVFALAAVVAWSTMPAAADSVTLYAAGSLRAALTEIAKSFGESSDVTVDGKFGPSGLLRDEIANGAKADVFASANMEHPAALAKTDKAGPVVMFARNRLCALVKGGLAVTPDNLLERMLDPQIKHGTATPKADPSGDYAFEVFVKADKLKPGANEMLSKKALQLTGGPSSPPPPATSRSAYGSLVAVGKADIFLTYCTNALVAQKENPGQQIVQLPAALSVGADYGMTVIKGASASAERLAKYILSVNGQTILAKHGFASPN